MSIAQLSIPEEMIDLGVGQPAVDLLPLSIMQQSAAHRLADGDPLILPLHHVQAMHTEVRPRGYWADGVDATIRGALLIPPEVVRVDDEEITNHNQVKNPDYIVVLDRTLIAPGMDAELKEGGSIIVNTPPDNTDYREHFTGRRVSTIDATSIAVANGLGTRTVPIVNTTMAGAMGRVLGLTLTEVLEGLSEGEQVVTSVEKEGLTRPQSTLHAELRLHQAALQGGAMT